MSSPRQTPLIFVLEPFGGSTREHSPALPMIFVDDAAVTRGEGVFESLRVLDGAVDNLQRHLDRFRRSARQLDIAPPDPQQWATATAQAAEKWEMLHPGVEAICRWTLTRGRESHPDIPSAWLVVSAIPESTMKQREQGISVMTGPKGYALTEPTPWTMSGAKSLSYASNMAAQRYARQHGFDDIIFCNGDEVLEGATSTVITVRGVKLRTPQPGGVVLAGTTQAELFAAATDMGFSCKAKTLMLEDLRKADSVWLVSSVRGAVRVRQLNEHRLAGKDDCFDFDAYLRSKAP